MAEHPAARSRWLRNRSSLALTIPSLRVFGFNPTGAPFDPNIFNLFNAWTNSRSRSRASIARGQAVFNSKPITISGVPE